MAENTKIEWCDATVNWWVGCTQVSPGCDHCYAKRIAAPFWGQKWGPGVPLQRFEGALESLKALDRKAQRLSRPLVVFHNSVSDMGDKDALDEWREAAFQGMAATPNLIHLVLTKRIGNLRQYLQGDKLAADLIRNGRVWLGITACNQEEADRDIPKLLDVPAAKRFLSMEPLLGPVDLTRIGAVDGVATINLLSRLSDWLDDDGKPWPAVPLIDWVIVGGESGPNARPMHPDWARSLRDQCQAAGVPFLFKQWGEWATVAESPVHPEATRLPGNLCRVTRDGITADHYVAISTDGGRRRYELQRVGKKAAGRLLDGHTWDGVPS